MTESTMLDQHEVAALLGVSESTVRRLARDGVLTRVRIGHRTSRYTHRSVLALIDPEASGQDRMLALIRDLADVLEASEDVQDPLHDALKETLLSEVDLMLARHGIKR